MSLCEAIVFSNSMELAEIPGINICNCISSIFHRNSFILSSLALKRASMVVLFAGFMIFVYINVIFTCTDLFFVYSQAL